MGENHVKSTDIKELKDRKKALKKEMELIQSEIESSLSEVRDTVSDRAKFQYWLDKYPLHLVGSAFVTGLLFAYKSGSRKKKSASEGILSGLLMSELKKLAVQRTAKYLLQRVEEALENRGKREE